ncbi:PLP-dependent aminotransferase family protein [Telmatospirillum sp.]|uniref:MocR-like pyridoxine biosynthesis transcription factor PdxR n=1 Tax=Telmatospirillum sp. TaxID=2079197 RepID=UPI00283D6567|nr:PLP-dependent aminotransferase family protein [Telmatospirillum sp.]MDR3435664.1 PLP-dependent aminotransferase family protein [Telmatospirillum sp.]
MPRAATPPLVLPALAPEEREPLQRQLYRHLRAAILDGRVGVGSRLPGSRSLAAHLGVSRNTVIAALDQLVAEGYVESRRGSGTTVAVPPVSLSAAAPVATADGAGQRAISRQTRRLVSSEVPVSRGLLLAFAPGMPALDAFPSRDWSRILARRWRHPAPGLLGGHDAAGYPPLRSAIAEYLGRARGVRCSADQVVVVAGSQQGLDLTARVLLDPGDQAMVEDPGYTGLRGVLRACGAVPVPVPVDDTGFDPGLAENLWPTARLACVTPSHQFPSGATMPADRRLALIAWAARKDGWIVEDDYDSDFRYAGRPLAALQGLDGGHRTIYCGTFSKSMFPALRLGWLVVPPDLLPAFLTMRRLADVAPSTVTQAAMADFMDEGLFTAHLRRMRALYAERRQALLASAARHLPGLAEVTAGEAGTHAIAWLPAGWEDLAVAVAAQSQGLVPGALGLYRLQPGRPGLILGYGNMPAETIDPAIRALRQVLAHWSR